MENERKETIFRGEIRYVKASEDAPTGRPAIIVSSNGYNRNGNYAEVVYLTAHNYATRPTHVPILTNRASTALCECICTVKKDLIGEKFGEATTAEMEDIDRALLYSLGLDREYRNMRLERDLYKKQYELLLEKMNINA